MINKATDILMEKSVIEQPVLHALSKGDKQDTFPDLKEFKISLESQIHEKYKQV